MPIQTRRIVRWTAVIIVCIIGTLACWQDPLYAYECLRASGYDAQAVPAR